MSKVLVTGANGFIAQHLVLQLLQKGYYVVGTVRSEAKGEALQLRFKDFEYEVVEDLLGNDLEKAIKKHPDIVGVFHTASPVFPGDVDFEKDVVIPAVEGTKKVLESVKANAPHVKRVIYTSSFVANMCEKEVIDEDDWNPIPRDSTGDESSAYFVSKTFAEKAVWEFLETEKPHFDINTVNPVLVLGPQAFEDNVKDTLNFSAEIVNSLLKLKAGEFPPNLASEFVDVRYVAAAHIAAFESDVSGQRLLAYTERFSSQLILDIINDNFPQLGLPKGNKGTGKDGFAKLLKVENSRTLKLVEAPQKRLKESVIDAVKQILRAR